MINSILFYFFFKRTLWNLENRYLSCRAGQEEALKPSIPYPFSSSSLFPDPCLLFFLSSFHETPEYVFEALEIKKLLRWINQLEISCPVFYHQDSKWSESEKISHSSGEVLSILTTHIYRSLHM